MNSGSERRTAQAGGPRVVLKKRLGRAIRGGQPWIYRDALASGPELPDGTLVTVTERDGRPLARGFWDARSPIAVRVLAQAGTGQPAEPRGEIDRRIAAALARRLERLDRAATTAFRWIHGEGDLLPGIHVDVYGTALSVRYDGGGARAFYGDLPARLRAAAGTAGLAITAVIERRPRGAGGTERAAAASGSLPEAELEVLENGLRFGADLRHGQKGGLFLDQRENRARVGALARDRRVLNLFGYTGAFSIYAAAGGARATTTVDVAAPAIEAARRNFARNRLPVAAARFAAEDVFSFLTRAAAAGERFELVISDPPSFAASRRALETGLRAYRRLHRMCAAVVAPGGILCAASCSSHVDRETFLATVRDGARDAGRPVVLRELHGAGFDHPVLPQFPEGDYLKFAVLIL